MAKKATAKKSRKSKSGKSKTPPKRRATSSDSISLSVTDGDMKDVIRTAFLRRNS
jgi:hypothetical protein